MQMKQRESSVTVRPDWIVLEEMEKTQLLKLSLPTVGDPQDVVCAGSMEYYDKAYDRVNVKSERPLKRIDRIFHTVTTTDDPVIRKLARPESDINVFATDAILATLMCCTRSVYSWDIVVQKIQGKVFLDKRDNTEFGNPFCERLCSADLKSLLFCFTCRSFDCERDLRRSPTR
jgi:translation initiation factor 3 subunit D